MTRDQWDVAWRFEFGKLRSDGYDPIRAQRVAWERTLLRYGQRPEGPGIIDKAVQALALRWLRGKIGGARKEGSGVLSKVLKVLDGWKLVIFVVGIAGASLYDQANNGHAGDTIGLLLSILGYSQGADWLTLARDMGTHLGAIGAIGHKVWKAQTQMRAGAKFSEALSTAGAVKAAVADGSLIVANNTVTDPAVLELDGKAVVAKVKGEAIIP